MVTSGDPISGSSPVPVAFLPDNSYVMQVGAYHDRENAAAAYTVLERAGFNPQYEDYQNLTRVVLPSVARNDLVHTRDRLKALGFGEPYIRQ
jgi:cell division protein FtsN